MTSQTNSQDKDPQKKGLYETISGSTELTSLLKRFGNMPFCERNAGFNTTAFSTAVFINLLSAAGSFYGLYWLMQFLTPYPLAISILCVFILGVCEWAKRKSSDNFWDTYHFKKEVQGGWLLLSFFLFIISAGLSALGTYQGIKDYAPPATLIVQDSTLINLNKKIAALDVDIAAAKETKWKGTTTEDATAIIADLNKMKAPLLQEATGREKFINNKNQTFETLQAATVEDVATALILVYLLLELIFESCMSFCSYFDMRKLLEKCEDNPEAFAVLLHSYMNNSSIRFDPKSALQLSKEQKQEPNEVNNTAQESVIVDMLKQIREAQTTEYKQPVVIGGFQAPKHPNNQAKNSPSLKGETTPNETAKSVVVQHSPPVSPPKQTAVVNTLNPVTKQVTETNTEIVLVNVNESYIRQKYTLAWKRYNTQDDNSTPKKNRDQLGRQLTALGYKIYEVKEPLTVLYKDGNGKLHGTPKLLKKYKDELL